jgi:osmotically-inducible protein OsmY
MADELSIEASEGVITVRGVVNAYWKKAAVEQAAQQVCGVKAVLSEVTVNAGAGRHRTDNEIANAVQSALQWNSSIEAIDVEVRVEDGWVYLQGKVDWHFQRELIEKVVEKLRGVTGVCNAIKVHPRFFNTEQIKGKIAEAFRRSATLDSASVQVETEGGRVSLRGIVKSWAEKMEAESIASAAPGVMTIDNGIEVDPTVLIAH